MTARDELTREQRSALAEQLGDARPARNSLLLSFGKSVQDRREHDHSTQREDWYCLNLAAYMGEKAAPVLRRLVDAEIELARLRAELAEVRAETFLEAADAIDNDDECGCGGCDTCQPRKLAAMLREKAGAPAPVPLVVSRYDEAMEPAPEEEPVLTVGAIAEDGRPVALLFDEDDRRKVAGWLAPDTSELLAQTTAFQIPWPGNWRPVLVQRSYAGGDRWFVGDGEGRRWDRDQGFVYEGPADERTRSDTRFPLAEAWLLAHRIAAGEAGE